MKKRKGVNNNMGQSANDFEYKELLLLAYFKDKYKEYDYSEVVKILGVTYKALQIMNDKLIEHKLIKKTTQFFVVSKQGEELLREKQLTNFFSNNKKIEKREKWDINKPYIPKKFSL